ncbi:1,6-anhydro-N-acetylmuramyl-L-alanine amidase AmpD [Marinagarivorans algicola]|uniref:1,6-anhydro-N-acetylmuramyl-L-alanine amidase AmpD n=1 Tax=Marinagarivorans algicola TaxID=1513270 RepID=UPI0009EA99E9|nr:1,6-anhydro-N-acetylmuramyl-L-alanine amidase AmpD [Marinagarivorans algicola]
MKKKTQHSQHRSSHLPPSLLNSGQTGWLCDTQHCPSPNFNQRPSGCPVSLLVIHNISLPPGQFGTNDIPAFFCNTLNIDKHPYFKTIGELQVSAHCLIERTGKVIQFVSFEARAWHAGQSLFEGQDNCNDYSIGIELEGTDDIPYTDAQYHSLIRLTKVLQQLYPLITPHRITGHQDIAPNRKTDPGPSFDWQRYKSALA